MITAHGLKTLAKAIAWRAVAVGAFAASLLMSLGSLASATAADISMSRSDTFGQSSFTTGTSWTGNAAPVAGNNYFTGSFTLRTPNDSSSNFTFAGDALTIDAGGAFNYKGLANTTPVITVNNLIMDGGLIGNVGNQITSGTSTLTLSGTMTVKSNSGINMGVGDSMSHNFVLNSTVTGTGGFYIGTSTVSGSVNPAMAVTINGNNSSFSGGFFISRNYTNKNNGTVTLNGTNATYPQLMSSATITLGHVNALGTGQLGIDAGTVNLNGYSPSIGSLSGTGGFVVNNGGGAVTFTVGNDNKSSTYSGSIQDRTSGAGTLALTKVGSGTLTLSGSNSYSGTTSINSGALQVGNGGTTGLLPSAGVITGSSGGTLNFSRTDNYGGNVANAIGGAIAVSQLGSGTLTLSGSNTFSGGATVALGRLVVGSSNALGTGTAAVSGGVLDVGTYAPSVAGFAITSGSVVGTTGTLTATTYALQGGSVNANLGTGTVNVTVGTTTLSGTTSASAINISSGSLALGGSALLSSNATVTVNGGVLDTTSSNYTATVGAFNMSSGSLNGGGTITASTYGLGGGTVTANLGSGTLNVTANSSLNGTAGATMLNLNAGTLLLGSAGRFTAAVAVTGSSGASLTLGGNETLGSLFGAANVGLGSSSLSVGSANTSGTYSGSLSGAGGSLTKAGSGSLVLSGSNSYTGSTTISVGALEFNTINALRNTSGVSIAGGASLRYSGAADVFNTNITVSSGTGTVTNSGGGTLTLGGTLSKDNSVLRLTGGSFNVTGLITGTTPGKSDLFVDAAGVTLSNTNTYNGPTVVYNSGTLSLGINNAIPNTSAVTLGNPTTRGTLVLGTFTDSISQLVFSGSGGALSLSGDKMAAAQLATNSSLTLGSNANLVLTSAGTSAGLYRLISFTSSSGSFANISGTSAAYRVITTSTSIDYQRRAEIGTITATPAAAAIITGGSTTFTFTVQNSTPAGGASLAPIFSAGSNVAGSAALASVAAESTSSSVSGFMFNGTSVGAARTGLFTVNDPNAIAATGTGSVLVDVYGHAAPSLTSSTLTLGHLHVGYGASGSSSNSLSATNGSGGNYIVALKGSSSAASGNVSLNSIAGIAAGGSGSITATLATGRSAGAINENFTYTFADDSTLSGALASVGTATIAVTGNVYTGQSTWATNGGGNWGTLTDAGANAFGSNWGTNQGSPGLDSSFANTDTATFDSALLSGTAAINTAGANISLKSLTFNNSAGSYEIYQNGGSGSLTLLAAGTNSAGITVAAGSHTIHADVALGSSTVIDVATGAALTLHTAISGSAAFGLTKTGSGTLYFDGSSSAYAGNTDIAQGLVRLVSGVNPLGTGTVTVRAGATLDLNYLSLSNPLNVLSGGILLNSGSLAAPISGSVTFSGTTNGTVTVGTNGNATFDSTVAGSVSISNGASATFTSAAPLTGSLNVLTGGSLTFNGSNTAGSSFNVASGGLVNVGSAASLGGQLHVSGSAVIAGSVTSNADVIVQSGGNVKLVDGASFAQTSLTNAGTLVIERTSALELATAISGSGGLQKAGAGTLFLSGSNGYTGATTISAGVVSIAAANALQSTSGVSIANGAGLTYTGGAGSLDRDITVTDGVGTVTNSGAGKLTLAGTLTKNGTVLQLFGGAFNVTGQIVGTSANSDLYVNGASVTLSNTNSYNGPTYVFNSGTLALGVSNAIPSNSVVTLGASGTSSATGPGTLDLGTSTNTIAGLVFSGSGNTLKMAANQTAAPQLATNDVLSPGAGNRLDLTGMGTSAGLYKLVSYTSNTGTFTAVTGLAAGYQLVYGTSELDAQQKAVLGTVTVTSPVTSIITGGSAAFTYTVANGAAGGGASLLFTGSGNSNVAGSSNGSAAAAGTSSSVAGLYFTGTGVGSGQTGTFNVNAPDAYGLTTATGTVSVTVLDHATSSLSSASTPLTAMSIILGQWNYATHTWESGTSTGAFAIHNLASQYGANLTADLSLLGVTGTGNGFTTNLMDTLATIAGGTSSQFSIFFDPTGLSSSGIQSTTFAISTSDKTGMSGATHSNSLYVTASVIVVPEPDTIIFAGIGIAMAGWTLWKRRCIAQILRNRQIYLKRSQPSG